MLVNIDRQATIDQRRAIEYSGKHLLINAGPGSGHLTIGVL